MTSQLGINDQCLISLALSVAESIDRGDDTRDAILAGVKDGRGYTVDVTLGGESDGWWTRVEDYRVDSSEYPIFARLVEDALADMREGSPALSFESPESRIARARQALA